MWHASAFGPAGRLLVGTDERSDLAGAAPAQGDPGTTVAVVVHEPYPGTVSLVLPEADGRTAGAQADHLLQHLRTTQRGREVAAALDDRRAGNRVDRGVPLAFLE